MIKLETIKVEVPEVKVISGKCDWCRKPFDILQESIRKTSLLSYGEINIHFGFGSNYDGQKWIGEICDDCFNKHLKPRMRLSHDEFA